MFSFISKFQLASLDKKILKYLKESDWYRENSVKDKSGLSLKDINRNEKWVQEISNFIDIVLSKKRYKQLIDETDLEKTDLVDIYILMTIATMPDPLFKTGYSNMSTTLVGSSIYQEIERQLKPLLSSLGINYNEHDHKTFGHKYASDVMIFALYLKRAHDSKYGPISLKETL